jgi:hypothetical protein
MHAVVEKAMSVMALLSSRAEAGREAIIATIVY